MLSKIPLIITDKNGLIIYCNEAAHNLCAALSLGETIEMLFDEDELVLYKQRLSSGVGSFSVDSSVLGGAKLIFDLTKEAVNGTRQIYVSRGSDEEITSISYAELAKSFSYALSDSTRSKRRFTELYEMLTSNNSSFRIIQQLKIYNLRELLDSFYEHILPNFLAVYGKIIETERGITEESVIFADPYSFYLTVSAMLSVASFVSQDHKIELDIDDRGDFTIVSVTALTSCFSDPIRMYGTHYIDLIFAETLANASGCKFSVENNRDTRRLRLTLCIKCHDYYPAYLKAKASISKIAAISAAAFPFSAEEQDDQHQ